MVCLFCIKSEAQCKFTCKDDLTFTINKQDLKCPSTYFCNQKKPLTSCAPCIREQCEEDAWTCDAVNKTLFSTKYSKGECLNGFVCKEEKVAPCSQQCYDPTGKRRFRSNYVANVRYFL